MNIKRESFNYKRPSSYIEDMLEKEISKILFKRKSGRRYIQDDLFAKTPNNINNKFNYNYQNINETIQPQMQSDANKEKAGRNYRREPFVNNENYNENFTSTQQNYLPFNESEIEPQYNEQIVEELMVLELMPAVAEWLDIHIERIVHEIVQKYLDRPENNYSDYIPEDETMYSNNNVRRNRNNMRSSYMMDDDDNRYSK